MLLLWCIFSSYKPYMTNKCSLFNHHSNTSVIGLKTLAYIIWLTYLILPMKTSVRYKQVVADHCHVSIDEIGLQ